MLQTPIPPLFTPQLSFLLISSHPLFSLTSHGSCSQCCSLPSVLQDFFSFFQNLHHLTGKNQPQEGIEVSFSRRWIPWLISEANYYLFVQVPLFYRDISAGGRAVSIRAQVTTEAPAKVEKISKKNEEGVIVNKFKPKDPYIGRCLLNTKITGDDAPGETWHMVFSTEGNTYPFIGNSEKPSSITCGVLISFSWLLDIKFDLSIGWRRRSSLQRRAIHWSNCWWCWQEWEASQAEIVLNCKQRPWWFWRLQNCKPFSLLNDLYFSFYVAAWFSQICRFYISVSPWLMLVFFYV